MDDFQELERSPLYGHSQILTVHYNIGFREGWHDVRVLPGCTVLAVEYVNLSGEQLQLFFVIETSVGEIIDAERSLNAGYLLAGDNVLVCDLKTCRKQFQNRSIQAKCVASVKTAVSVRNSQGAHC